MEFEFVPVDYDYFDFEGRNYVRLVGRNGKGEKVCVVDSYEPNFYLVLKEGADAENIVDQIKDVSVEKASRITKVLRTEILDKKFLGKNVKAIRVYIDNHKDAHEIASAIGDIEGIDKRREYDIPIITKYIKEKKVEPLRRYRVRGRKMEDGGQGLSIPCFEAQEILPSKNDEEFTPKILAYDIETSDRELGKGDIFMISLYGEGTRSETSRGDGQQVTGDREDSDIFKKVLTWKHCEKKEDYMEFYESEAEMLKGFVKHVNEYSPDILAGYFSDGFDLPYLKGRADVHKVKLSLGIDGKKPNFTRGRIPSGKIAGIVHVDLYRFIDAVFSQYLQSETLSLNEVARELVGEEKEDFDFVKLGNMSDSDWYDFISYNLQDSAVTYKLAQKIWPDVAEFTKIIKEPVFDVTRDRMATHVENHIIHNLDRFNEIVDKRPGFAETNERKMKGKFEGAFVFEPKPGFYEDLVMFDFTSMHASIIVSFNVSKATLRSDCEGNHQTPEFVLDGEKTRVCFSKEAGFFSTLLSEVVDKRKKYKKEYFANENPMTKARSNAYKLLANATFGYQGFFGARYYSRESAAATLAFVRKYTHDTMNKIEDAGYTIIYGDTDSIAFLQNSKSKDEIMKFLGEINDDLPGIMELDLEDFYSKGLFVAKRGSTTGAKKKYALMDSRDKIKIRGFETVRRDWCKLTRGLQSEVLNLILTDGNEKAALKLTKETIKRLKDRSVDFEDLMIRTQLKREISDYTATGPHVVAAKKMVAAGVAVSPGMLIEYFVGEGSGKRVGDRVYLAGERVKYDIDYYLGNQIVPSVEGIFNVFDVNVKDIVSGSKQQKLF